MKILQINVKCHRFVNLSSILMEIKWIAILKADTESQNVTMCLHTTNSENTFVDLLIKSIDLSSFLNCVF